MSKRVSKFLSLVLRHEPARVGITLDNAGWTDVAALLDACAAHGVAITRDELAAIVASSDKQRFALSPDGTRIRANQGHSIDVELDLAPLAPPDRLFHGTVDRFVASIRASGLVKGERHHVHLSADRDTAEHVGSRRGKPVVLVVRAGAMAAAGHVFYRSANGVWLVEHVPPEFIDLPVNRSAGGGNRSMKVTIAKTTLAACDAGHYTNGRGERVDLARAIDDAKAGTVAYEPGGFDAGHPRAATALAVTGETTIDALVRLAPRRDHLGVLNFASAKNAGGGFLGGAQAQEESLARSSALYPCQCTQPAFYADNRAHRSALYLDRAIYSPRVPFFRTDDGNWLDAPVLASVITCAAPNASALRQQGRFDRAEVEAALRRRAGFVLAIARHHAIDTLVLGAWGAGVFGNDPAMVADAWKVLLAGDYARAFDRVVFAVLGDRESSANHRAFADAFG
ncbi:MAG TPA: TIGR02452 family protein [Kofleriaceae bacterium]|nr:TIGR02452 family protein [Kofleriaceae bacterium]